MFPLPNLKLFPIKIHGSGANSFSFFSLQANNMADAVTQPPPAKKVCNKPALWHYTRLK